MGITARTSAINSLRVVKKMPPKMRPDANRLYSFLEGLPDKLSVAQIERMKEIVQKDAAEYVAYLDECLTEHQRRK